MALLQEKSTLYHYIISVPKILQSRHLKNIHHHLKSDPDLQSFSNISILIKWIKRQQKLKIKTWDPWKISTNTSMQLTNKNLSKENFWNFIFPKKLIIKARNFILLIWSFLNLKVVKWTNKKLKNFSIILSML